MASSSGSRPPSQRLGTRPPSLRTPSSGGRSSPLRQSWRGGVKDEPDEEMYASGSGTSGLQVDVKPMLTKREEEGDVKMDYNDVAVKEEKTSLSSASSSASSPNPSYMLDEPSKPIASPSTPTQQTAKQKAASMKEDLAKRRAFIHHLPRAEKEALETFTVLQENMFQNKGMGRSGQTEDSMFCDCTFDPDSDEGYLACGIQSNCINRLTQIECLHNECQTQGYCRNQRFARREYSDVQVVQTEKKGFGLRAGADIEAEAFIYEYIGEVVTQPSLEKRMQAYAEEGIPHFYFMMLQKEEYLDATKKGGIARFANHSCNPNCHVQKWVVGKRVRMGIFAMRDIDAGEELTFNYNVDRYGHVAQTCHCEEPNCVGTIGGKTQTDIGGMDELYIEALGIADEVAVLEARGTKRKKGKKLDDDFNPILRPLEESEVPKVVAALRQSTENRKMLLKLLDRVQMTMDPAVQGALMRMHGFSLFALLLNQFPDDQEILLPALVTLNLWKPQVRNQVEDSKIEEPIRRCRDISGGTLAGLAEELLTRWAGLTTVWRIPRKIHVVDTEDDVPAGLVADTREVPAAEAVRFTASWAKPPVSTFQLTQVAPVDRSRTISHPPTIAPSTPIAYAALSNSYVDRNRLESILALAKMNQAEAAVVPSSHVGDSPRKRDRARDGASDERRKRPRASDDELRAKRLLKVVGEFVVRTMSKYKDQMERETFKRYAKECTQVLADKEKKGKTWLQGFKYDTLPEDKKAKMKLFIKEYAHKILKKLKDKGKLLTPHRPDERKIPGGEAGASAPPHSASAESFDEDTRLLQDMFGPDLGDDDLEEDDSHTGSSRDRLEDDLGTPELASPADEPMLASTAQTPDTPPTPPHLMEKTFAALSGY